MIMVQMIDVVKSKVKAPVRLQTWGLVKAVIVITLSFDIIRKNTNKMASLQNAIGDVDLFPQWGEGGGGGGGEQKSYNHV